MNTETSEIMSAEDAKKFDDELNQLHCELDKLEASECIPMHLEDRLRYHERRVREREQRQRAKHALKNGR